MEALLFIGIVALCIYIFKKIVDHNEFKQYQLERNVP